MQSSDNSLRATSLRACATCVRAKAKCVPVEESPGKCQRCHRLSKPCEPVALRARTEPRKRKAIDSSRISKVRVGKLEEKLDDLVVLLKSTTQSTGTSAFSAQTSSVPTISATSSDVEHRNTTPDTSAPSPNGELPYKSCQLDAQSETEEWEERLRLGGPAPKRFGVPTDVFYKVPKWKIDLVRPQYDAAECVLDLGGQSPDVLLHIFRSDMIHYYPFIRLSNDVTAALLCKERPAVYVAIMAVAGRITSVQKSITLLLTKQLAERVHIYHERSIDLLLGCLIFLTWWPAHFFNIPQTTSLLTTAHTLVADMGLNRVPQREDPGPFKNAVLSSCGVVLAEPQRTLEERRAALAVWHITSVSAAFFHRLEKPTWFPYYDQCCLALSESGNDLCTIGMVKIQLLTEKLLQSPWHSSLYSASNEVVPLPPMIYLKSIETQIEDLERELSPILPNNPVLRMGLSNHRILLNKIGLSKANALSTFTAHDFNRVELLYKCFQACKSFFLDYLGIPVEQHASVTVPMTSQVTANLGILQLLSTYEHPEWDSSILVRENLTFLTVLSCVEKKYGAAKAVLGIDPHTSEGEDIFSHTSAKMRWLLAYFSSDATDPAARQLQRQECLRTFFPETEQITSGADSTLADPLPTDMMDLLDDAWMRDIFLPWESQNVP